MAATPSVAEVRAVITTTLGDEQVQARIDDAALIVDGCPAIVVMSDAQQKAIVKWVAAHLIASSTAEGAQVLSKKLGDASETYSRASLGIGLAGTYYGQQALLLDPTGCLARRGRQRAFVKVL